MRTLGVGVDTVHVPAFRDQLADPASSFVRGTFTEAERACAAARPGGDTARHLAARFAAKEAFIKAWSGARWGQAPQMDRADLRQIEVVSDPWGRPSLVLHGAVADAVARLGAVRVHVSLSHDGDQAIALVQLEAAPARTNTNTNTRGGSAPPELPEQPDPPDPEVNR